MREAPNMNNNSRAFGIDGDFRAHPVLEGDPNDPTTWGIADMDAELKPKPVPQVMGDPNNSETWRVIDTDSVMKQDSVQNPDSNNTPVESTEAAPTNLPIEEVQTIREGEEEIYSRYKNEFNIDAADLNNIEGFNSLNSDQKEFVLQNLQQTALKQIESEGIIKQRQELAQASVFKRILLGATKGYQLNKQKKAIAEDIFRGNVDQTETLTALVGMVIEGPRVTKQEDGSFKVDTTSAEDFNGDLSERDHEAIDLFNDKANKFNTFPYEYKTGTPEQQDQYKTLEEDYKAARNTLLLIKKAQGTSEKEQLLYGNEIDRKVMMGQFISSNPEVDSALMNIKNDSVIKQTIQEILNPKGVATSKGGIFAMGLGARTATTSLLGAAAIPLVGAGIGLWRGRVDAKEKISQNELLARSGETWEQDKSWLDKKYEEKKGKNVANEVRHNIISAEHLSGKIEMMIERIEEEHDDKTREILLSKLQARISYTEDKIRSNMVNFGKAHSQTGNQLDLLQALGTAKAYGERPTDEALAERVDRYLGYIDNTVDANQKKFVNRRMFQGAALGAGFAFAGAAVAEGYSEFSSDSSLETASIPRDFNNDIVEVGGNPVGPEQGIPLSPAQERFITIAGDTPAPYDMAKDIVDVGGTPTEKIDPLGPSDGEPVRKTFVGVAELDSGYVASPEISEKMEAFINGEQTPSPDGAPGTRDLGTERQPPEHLQQRMADFKQEHGLGEGVPLTADEVVQQEINRHDSMMFGEMATPIPETPSTSFELDDHAKDLLQKEAAELRYTAPLDTYTAGRLEQEANIQALVKEINQTPGYTVQPGDNVWNIIEKKLEAHHLFRDLGDGQRNHLIDELKDKVANMSADEIREFGIKSGDPNIIKADEYLNFSKILGVDTIEKAVFNAENLSAAQIENIENYVPPQPDKVSVAESVINQTEGTTGKVTSGFEADGDTIFVGEGPQRDQLLEQESGMNPEYDKMLDAQTAVFRAEAMVNEDLTKMYGSKGIFGSGLGGTEGSRSIDWLDLKDKTVTELIGKKDFPTQDLWGNQIDTKWGFDSKYKVDKMVKYIFKLAEESHLKPEQNETVANFIQRASEKMLTPSE